MTDPSLSGSGFRGTKGPPDCRIIGACAGCAGRSDEMGIGFRELLIILAIALLIFGAKKLRTIGSDLGAAVRGFKKSMNEGDSEESAKKIQQDDRPDSDSSKQA